MLLALGMLADVTDREQYVQSQMLLAAADGKHMSSAEFSNYYSSLQFAGALLRCSVDAASWVAKHLPNLFGNGSACGFMCTFAKCVLRHPTKLHNVHAWRAPATL